MRSLSAQKMTDGSFRTTRLEGSVSSGRPQHSEDIDWNELFRGGEWLEFLPGRLYLHPDHPKEEESIEVNQTKVLSITLIER